MLDQGIDSLKNTNFAVLYSTKNTAVLEISPFNLRLPDVTLRQERPSEVDSIRRAVNRINEIPDLAWLVCGRLEAAFRIGTRVVDSFACKGAGLVSEFHAIRLRLDLKVIGTFAKALEILGRW